MNQVFSDNEYSCVQLRSTNGLIIDGGANVGYTSVYLAGKFPTVTIVAVEPDPDNFRILERNVRQYPNVVPIRAALWGFSGYISMSPSQFRDGNSWARTVSQEKGDVRAYTVNELIDLYYPGQGEICVKIDVEGAETHIFQNQPKLWLGRCCQVVIELHPDSPFGDPTPLVDDIFCTETFIRTWSGELAVFTSKVTRS
jgi:FkbM family methyltransferase